MEIIAKVTSLFILVLGVSYLIQARMWAEIGGEIAQQPHRGLLGALGTLVFGLVIVTGHNVWGFGWPVIITILGWSMMIKTAIYLMYPQWAKAFASWPKDALTKWTRASGIWVTILGAVLVYVFVFS